MNVHLRTRLTAVLAAFSLVPLAVAMSVGYMQSRSELMAARSDRLDALATLKAAQLRSHTEQHVRLAHKLQQDFLARRMGDLPRAGRLAPWSTWLRAAAVTTTDADLALIDLEGTVLAANRAGYIGRNWSGSPRLESGRLCTQVVGPHRHPGVNAVVLNAIYVPLRATDGPTIAELVVIGNQEILQTWLQEDMTPELVVSLTDLQNRPLARWPPGSGSGEPDVTDTKVWATKRVEPVGARLTLRMPEGAVLQQLQVLGKMGIWALLVVALLTVPMAMFFGRTLSKPVLSLAEQARRMGKGDLSPLAPVDRQDEIGVLWQSMDRMRAELVSARDRLQDLLDNRTRSLRERERLLSSLFEILPDVVLVVDRERTVQAANRTVEKLFGDNIEGRRCYDVLYGLDEICPDCPLDDVLAGRPSLGFKPTGGNRSGEAIVYDLVPLGTQGQPTDSAVYSGRVITKERLLQQRLVHQEKMAAIGGLAAGVAHEISNPLASLSALAQVRLRKSPDSQEQADMSMVQNHLKRIERAVKSMTRLARGSGSGRHRVLLQVLAERAIKLISFDPRARDVELVSRFDPEVPAIELDEDAWLHALLNLLVNALDAVAENTERRIEVSVESRGGNAVLAVIDSGCGMSSETRLRSTEPMFTTKPPGQGTGMGLHLVREVVEGHDGNLEIDSAPGKGTTARLVIPSRTPAEIGHTSDAGRITADQEPAE